MAKYQAQANERRHWYLRCRALCSFLRLRGLVAVAQHLTRHSRHFCLPCLHLRLILYPRVCFGSWCKLFSFETLRRAT